MDMLVGQQYRKVCSYYMSYPDSHRNRLASERSLATYESVRGVLPDHWHCGE